MDAFKQFPYTCPTRYVWKRAISCTYQTLVSNPRSTWSAGSPRIPQKDRLRRRAIGQSAYRQWIVERVVVPVNQKRPPHKPRLDGMPQGVLRYFHRIRIRSGLRLAGGHQATHRQKGMNRYFRTSIVPLLFTIPRAMPSKTKWWMGRIENQ